MAGSHKGGSSDARWFALGMLIVGGVIALAAWNQAGRPFMNSGLLTDDSAQAAGHVAEDVPAKMQPKAPEPVANDPVLARGLKQVEPEIVADRERTADELLTSAREALKRGRSTEAYRYATMSLRKKRTQAGLEIKAKAACRVGGKAAAKTAARDLDGPRRRAVRRECRKHGLWLAL